MLESIDDAPLTAAERTDDHEKLITAHKKSSKLDQELTLLLSITRTKKRTHLKYKPRHTPN